MAAALAQAGVGAGDTVAHGADVALQRVEIDEQGGCINLGKRHADGSGCGQHGDGKPLVGPAERRVVLAGIPARGKRLTAGTGKNAASGREFPPGSLELQK